MTSHELTKPELTQKIAIIGSGISGLTSAYYLTKAGYQVTLFEANDYIGGHTATKTVSIEGQQYDIDTGFIVFNDWTYPNFIRLMDELKVASQPTRMSFSVKDVNFEYAGGNLDTLFGQRSNLFSLSFMKMVQDILRFNKEAIVDVQSGQFQGWTLGHYLERKGYSRRFVEHYLIPMGSAIWSCSTAMMHEFELDFFVRFFKNHGLLSVKNRPQWHVIQGGSKQYIEPLIAQFKSQIQLNNGVQSLTRHPDGVQLMDQQGQNHHFDQVIFACHSDQAIKILADASDAEKAIVGAIKYQNNEVVLHTDQRLLPKRKKLWSAWHYRLNHDDQRPATLTYDMNLLQGINSDTQFCVTLNDTDLIAPDKILGRYVYAHPIFSKQNEAAKNRWAEVNGVNKTWFCGAYWRNGFHEDGVISAIRAINGLHQQRLQQDIVPQLGDF